MISPGTTGAGGWTAARPATAAAVGTEAGGSAPRATWLSFQDQMAAAKIVALARTARPVRGFTGRISRSREGSQVSDCFSQASLATARAQERYGLAAMASRRAN